MLANMDYYLTILVTLMVAPLAAGVVIVNMAKTEHRRLQKMKERADKKTTQNR
jgi:hypothetical protein|tara:strand:- start:482 stop:640 length:159 start_codon:yes stop_codon:yes gene_type:complete